MTKKNFSNEQLDQLLAEVDQTFDALAKNVPQPPPNGSLPAVAKDEDSPEDDGQGAAPTDAPSDSAPTEEAPPEPSPEGPPAAPEAEAAPADDGATPPEGEGELSDEELAHIYGQMPPEELERHYMAIKQLLAQHMGAGPEGAEAPPAEEPPPAAPPSPEAPPAPEDHLKSEGKVKELEERLKKSEEANKAMEGTLAKLVASLEKAVKPPTRKSIAGTDYIRKNEGESGSGDAPTALSKSQKKDKLRDLTKSGDFYKKLSSDDRTAINNFILRDEDESKIDKLIGGTK